EPIACGMTISAGVITADQTWPGNGCETFIDGQVIVRAPAVLTILPCAIVKAVKFTIHPYSALIIEQGAKINAAGTAGAPIVFTGDQTTRHAGDWVGLVLNGNAPVNCPGGQCLAPGIRQEAFGGNDPSDSSGILRYVRVEFAGGEPAPDSRSGALSLNGTGSCTFVDHVQVNASQLDCFDFAGGTTQAKYLVGSGCEQDAIAWFAGYAGALQHVLGMYDAAHVGPFSRGIAGDNNENGFDFLPRANPRLCNLTLVGTKSQGEAVGAPRTGILLRRGTAGKIYDALVADFPQAGADLRNNQTAAQACLPGPVLDTSEPFLALRSVLLSDNGSPTQITGDTTNPCTPAQWLTLLNAPNDVQPGSPGDVGPDPMITVASYPTTVTNQYIPPKGGPADHGTACAALDPSFFDPVSYVGAFAPGSGTTGNWLMTPGNWISFATQ